MPKKYTVQFAVKPSGAISKREAAIQTIIAGIKLMELDKKHPYATELEASLRAMTDAQFDKFMDDIDNDRNYVPFVTESFDKPSVSLENNYKVAPEFNVNFHEKLVITDESTGVTYVSKYEAMILMPPVRRQVQTGESGISVPSSKMITDDLTDQVTGDSSSMKITNPEINGLMAREMPNCLKEFVAVRAGNNDSNERLRSSIIQTGHGRLDDALSTGTRAKVTDTFSTYLKAMHFGNNL